MAAEMTVTIRVPLNSGSRPNWSRLIWNSVPPKKARGSTIVKNVTASLASRTTILSVTSIERLAHSRAIVPIHPFPRRGRAGGT